jgi:hypothetical protein
MDQTRMDRQPVGSGARRDGPGGESLGIALTGLAALACVSGSLFRLAIPLGAVAVGLGRAKLLRASTAGEGIGRAAAGMVTGGVALVAGVLLLGAALLANPSSSTLLGLPPSLTLGGEAGAVPEQELPPETAIPPTAPPETTPPTTPQVPAAMAPDGVDASATADSGQDSQGNVVEYRAENMLDGDPATAWRVEGNGVGETLTFSWSQPVHLTAIEMVPGYAKQDVDGTDRFHQNRRVRLVRVRFDSGDPPVELSFDDEPVLQRRELDADATTVTVEILATRKGSPDRDYTAISEIGFQGYPADLGD